MPPARAYLVTG